MKIKPLSIFSTEEPPRFIVRKKFRAGFLTSYRGLAFTGGGDCELYAGTELICIKWDDGHRAHGLFRTADPDLFDKQWVLAEELSHPRYIGSVILLDEEQLSINCEKLE